MRYKGFIKDPDATLDYKVDWAAYLDDGDSIVTSTFIAPTGITIEDGSGVAPAPSHTATAATAWISGGTADKSYAVVNRITTMQGRTDDRTIVILVRDR